MPVVAMSEILRFQLYIVSIAEQAGLSLNWSPFSKDRFSPGMPHLLIYGVSLDVVGIISDIIVINTVYESKIVRENPSLSPDSVGSRKLSTIQIDRSTAGMTKYMM